MELGNSIDEIEVDLRFFVLKLLYVIWLVSFYNYLIGSVEKWYIVKGWSKVGIFEFV